jgi:molybdopterin/thiamine biosynthesis adenylyltransferase
MWSYEAAFERNRGLLSAEEQRRLRFTSVAIAGVGGVGGGHAIALARQGVGRFHLADPDIFSVSNFNRQMGARLSSLGENKAVELRRMILDINPEAEVTVFDGGIGAGNIGAFLDGVDVVVDGIDFFSVDVRRLLFAEARLRGLWALTAGPLGFSAALLALDPRGMSFDSYCDLNDDMTRTEQLVAIAVALAPAGTHLRYIDFSEVRVAEGVAPSAGLACLMTSAFIAMETIAIVLGRRAPKAAPSFAQFDIYRQVFRRGRLRLGNRGPLQRLKRFILHRHLVKLGVLPAPAQSGRVLAEVSR